jgi:2-methylisocitrate lyase-like PEP mutase family enzyme
MSLRDLLAGPDIVVAPGIYDGLTAMLVGEAGFHAAYLSGANICYTRFGFPDIGLVSMSEVADTLSTIRERSELPIIVDIDTGFGNALNVRRTVQVFEARGAAAVQLEDQVTPKRCGHLAGKELISTAEMVNKIKAATDARRSRDMLLIARTDAIAVEGFERALDRGEAFVAAGADVLFVEAPTTREQQAEIGRRFGARVPVLANMVEGGHTPAASAAELQALGYKLVIFPGGTVRALAVALRDYFTSLKTAGTTAPFRDRMLDLTSLNRLLDAPGFMTRGKRYDAGSAA